MLNIFTFIFLLTFSFISSEEQLSPEESALKLSECILSKKNKKIDNNHDIYTNEGYENAASTKDPSCTKENINKYLLKLKSPELTSPNWYLFILFLILLFFILIIFKLFKKIILIEDKLNRSLETIHDILESNSNKEINNEMFQRLLNIEARQFGIEESIEEILTKSNLPQNIETIIGSNDKDQINPFYMIYPNKNGIFPQNAKRKNKENTTYVFYPINEYQSEFEISYDSEMLGRILNSEDAYLKPACDSINSLDFSALQITNIQKGQAIKEGNSWKVVKKAIIRYD
jgi:hypothetical protein